MLSELDQVVGKLKHNKSPGWDGLTAEFYQEFWLDIREVLFNSFIESIGRGDMTPSQRIGILTLIPKPKTPVELCYIKNWRPITLLNTDYKIFTHVIKNRLIKAIPCIISNVQSGFQAGKSSCDNLILLCLTLEHFNNNPEEEGLLLQVDFEKAFDSIEHTFLFKTLEVMGIGDYVIKLIKVAFTGCMSFANINGYLSKPIYLMRGLHQGSPLSPILFLMIAQVFSNKLKISHDITGFAIQGIDILLSLFADDTDIFLQATSQAVEAVIRELNNFGYHSGCNPNVAKTFCIPLGNAKNNDNLLQDIRIKYGDNFIKHSFSALGVAFRNDLSINDIVEINYNSKIDKAKSWAGIWGKRDLTLFRKVTIIKSLIFSQIIYVVAPLPRPSARIISKLNTVIFNFLWGCKRDKIKREVVTRSRQEGGLGIFITDDFILSLKLSLTGKIFNQSFSHTWKDIVINQLRYPDNPLISVENGRVGKNSIFTKDLIDCYEEWKLKVAAKTAGCVDHCIWGNKLITGMWNKQLWNTNLINRGVLYISHLFNLNSPYTTMSYSEFCNRWSCTHEDVSQRDYTMIRWAIKEYMRSSSNTITDICTETHLSYIITRQNNGPVQGHRIRDLMTGFVCPNDLVPLKKWCKNINIAYIDWVSVFNSLFYCKINNYKLMQFQYKLLMRISTCKYMRYKMNIEKSSPYCSHCSSSLETLPHIFLQCSHTLDFKSRLNAFIILKLDHQYRDPKNFHFLTCNHENKAINYINMVAKWYISKQFQNQLKLDWLGYKRFTKLVITGEKPHITNILEEVGLLS